MRRANSDLGTWTSSRPRVPRGMRLRLDHDPILDLGDAGRRPGDTFCLLAFGPGAHRALEHDLATSRLDGDAVRIDLRAAPECLLDFAFDLRGLDPWLQADKIADSLHPLNSPNR